MAETEAKTPSVGLPISLPDEAGNDLVELNKRAVQRNENVSVSGETGFADDEAPPTIKEILAELDGDFPMDEAVIEGKSPLKTFVSNPGMIT